MVGPMEMFDIIIYAAIAVFLASRLWSVLGQKGEDDAPPRVNPLASKEPAKDDEENVMVLEARPRAAQQLSALTAEGHAPTSLVGALEQIRQEDKTFDEKKFLDGAKIAFANIVKAYAEGDLSPVARFLGPAVAQPFESAIRQRKESRQKLENTIHKIVAADIVAAQKKESRVLLSVEFISHQVNLLKDSEGQIIDGVPGQAEEVRDLWVFSRDLHSPNPNWQLIETKA